MTPIDSNAPVGRRLAAGLLAGLLVLSACAATTSMGDSVTYAPPTRAVAGPLIVSAPGGSARALRSIASALRRAGFEVESQDPATGKLLARSRRHDLVDCGVLTQTARGSAARIDGASPLAAIFDAGAQGGVLRREVRVTTEVTVQIVAGDPQKATVDEKQTVTLRKLTADGGTILSSQTLEANSGQSMAFSDGTVCTSSGRLAEAFR